MSPLRRPYRTSGTRLSRTSAAGTTEKESAIPSTAAAGWATVSPARVDTYPVIPRTSESTAAPSAMPVVSPAVHTPPKAPPRPSPCVRASCAMASGSIASGSACMPAYATPASAVGT